MPKDILVLMTDQHRADWVGALGGGHVKTPSLDALASEGATFTRCYTPSPICMPARASFLSGMYPHSHGLWDNNGRLQDEKETYLHALKQCGYRTCHVGKSHLYSHGGGKDLREEEPYMRSLGWDDIRECTGPLSTQTTTSILTDWMKERGIYQLFLDDYRKRRETGMNRALWPSPLPDGEHMDDFIAGQAVDYIQGCDASAPLLVFVGIGGPHNPWDPPASYDHYSNDDMPPPLPRDDAPDWLHGAALDYHNQMMSANPDITQEQWRRVRALYSARVEHVDALMGQIVEAWQAARGRDTWILFWSDHGEMAGDKGRCSKSVYYESSAHVPAILRPPGGRKPVHCSGLVSLVDLNATLLEIGECDRVSPNAFGQSLCAVYDSPDTMGSQTVFSEIYDTTMAFDGRMKLVVNRRDETLQLFDLNADPGETLNLAGHPDYQTDERRLRDELLRFHLRTAYCQHREKNG